MDEAVKLINYKGFDILVRERNRKYQMGIKDRRSCFIWLNNGIYKNPSMAQTSGMEYARTVVDKIIVSQKI